MKPDFFNSKIDSLKSKIDSLKSKIDSLIHDARRLKIIAVCAFVLLESIVLIGAAFDRTPEADIIGGADGSTSVITSETEANPFLDQLIASLREDADREDADNKAQPEETTGQERQEALERGLLILINKENPVDRSYKPDDLTPVKYYASDRSEAGRYMREEAAEHFHRLVEAAAEEGYELVMTTAYRSYGFQQTLWNNYVASEGEAAASRFSARPGQSEHQSGLAVDVSSPSVDYALTESFGETEEGKWLARNAHRFGFIIRFPQGKENITGYLYEPWHIRYVGEPVAAEIYANELTLEEYLEQ